MQNSINDIKFISEVNYFRILIVEKETRYEYLSKNHELSDINSKKIIEIKNDHLQHQAAKNILEKELSKQNLDYKIIKDNTISQTNFSNYNIIISVGGDGTFLNSSAKIQDQIIIGINSDPNNSRGGLVKFISTDIPKICLSIKSNNLNIEYYDRLSAKINGELVLFSAINEVLITKPNIYQTSKLKIEIGTTKGYCSGNGIIISTQKGSTAFYHSADGKAFDSKCFGYSLVLPFEIHGDLLKSSILNQHEKIMVTTKRSGHCLIFDCDQKRIIKLKDEDKIEIYWDTKNSLKVLV